MDAAYTINPKGQLFRRSKRERMSLSLITLKMPSQISSDPECCDVTGLSNVSGHWLQESIKHIGKGSQSLC